MRLTFTDFVRGQLAKVPSAVTSDLKDKTVMVVGANTGLGFQASIHFARMNPARLILCCRSPSKGKAAVERRFFFLSHIYSTGSYHSVS